MLRIHQSVYCAGSASARTWHWILILPMVLCLLPALARGAIDISETGLHDRDEVHGLLVPTPDVYLNTNAISISGWGQTDPTLHADVSFSLYGIFCDEFTINEGAITVTGTGGAADAYAADAYVRAHGIYADFGAVDNCSPIGVTAVGGTATSASTSTVDDTEAFARAFGIYSGDGAIINDGPVTVSATGGSASSSILITPHELFASAQAYGLFLCDHGNRLFVPRSVVNSGTIAVTATGGNVAASCDEANTSARAYGIVSDIAAVRNSGSIAATAIGGSVDSSEYFVDSKAYASAWAYGVHADYVRGVLGNSGAITASAEGGTIVGLGTKEASANAEAYGIDAEWDPAHGHDIDGKVRDWLGLGGWDPDPVHGTNPVLHNDGEIRVSATGGRVESVSAHPGASATARAEGLRAAYGDIDNSGAVTVTATGGVTSAAAGPGADASVVAYGLNADGNVENTGAVTVTATGGVASGVSVFADAQAYGIYSSGNVTNYGDVTVSATAEAGSDAIAYGIRCLGGSALTNTGIIRALGDEAYEVYASGAVTLVDTYNVTLDGNPDQASIYVSDAASLALNNATLTATAVAGETLWDTPYKLFETEGTGVVTGGFRAVETIHPAATAVYDARGTSSAADDTVALSYAPRASETTGSAAVAQQLVSRSIDVVNQHMTTTVLQNILSLGTSGLLADAGPTAQSMVLAQSDSGTESGLFVDPYYSTMEHDANPLGYDARVWGFAAGYERQMDDTLIGLHAGYGQADVDYTGTGYSANSEDQDILTGGVSGLTRWNDWTLRYGLTGFYGSHDYRGLTGLSLNETETASMDSYGVMASVMAGHIFQRDAHVFLPEVGVNYIWGHRQRYTTDASDPAWDTTYSATNDHDLQAEAALHWLCGFMYRDIHVLPSASIGVRHLLTDGESTVSQSVPGTAPVLVTSERDRTAMTLSGSVALTRGRHTVSASYDGEYAPDTQRHSFWLRYGWQF